MPASPKLRRPRWQIGEYIRLDWEYEPEFYAVRGHVPPEKAAAEVNNYWGSGFAASQFEHRWMRFQPDLSGEMAVFLCAPDAAFRIAITAVLL